MSRTEAVGLIDAALDERLLLMALRDGAAPATA